MDRVSYGQLGEAARPMLLDPEVSAQLQRAAALLRASRSMQGRRRWTVTIEDGFGATRLRAKVAFENVDALREDLAAAGFVQVIAPGQGCHAFRMERG